MKKMLIVLMLVSLLSVPALAITIVNADFETGSDNDAPPTGWTDNIPTGFWQGLPGEQGNPTQAEWDTAPAPGLGTMILTTARQSAGVGSQPVNGQLVQSCDFDAGEITDIDAGTAELFIGFLFGSDDYRDTGSFSLHFFDGTGGSGSELGSGYSRALDDARNGQWEFTGWLQMFVGGAVPVGARSVMLQIDTTRSDGSETNIWIDNIAEVPEPATIALLSLGGLLLRKRR